MKLILLLIPLSLFIFSCGKTSLYNKSIQFENNEWKQKTRPTFVVYIPDTVNTYDFTLTIRTTTDYKFNNIWLFLNTKTPSNQEVREPYEIKTTFPNGAWVGKKTGTIVEHQLIFKRRKLPSKGKYTFMIEQGVTQKVLEDILDISFNVTIAED